ncbi:hypothetical protein Kpol_163p2 [Vanderwaltozyma polyspora DSM 70294]|uniref:Secreted protein CSS2 C-terminal domain-containing protein n=1 Tax=Vanderwaltozyma polyspora (strain ATCC 22028 / DSM 70294 / BCRC 21397 / CBS 2163 / NBRC 10782 / NRRL Y-8283 / UCD 57-17) TaxID=436907 RepID=A7TTS4_VANPO|nr:uncharacterized protein Kpol_163p2 [Vanderwaltozyma polyspora DSM 70294]EDO14334.1 hypothetical protein Kpol_163p2 [Vanderwaltozyma polyspora DSM 70294]
MVTALLLCILSNYVSLCLGDIVSGNTTVLSNNTYNAFSGELVNVTYDELKTVYFFKDGTNVTAYNLAMGSPEHIARQYGTYGPGDGSGASYQGIAVNTLALREVAQNLAVAGPSPKLTRRNVEDANAIYEHLLNQLGATSDTPTYMPKREAAVNHCDSGYARTWIDTVYCFWENRDVVMRIISKTWTWTLDTGLLGDAPGWIRVSLGVFQQAQQSSQKTVCGSVTQWYDTYPNGGSDKVSYLIAVSAYTTGKNCDTTASEDTIRQAFAGAAQAVSNTDASSWCIHFNHRGTWNADIRVSLWDDVHFCSQNIWDIPCPDNGQWQPGKNYIKDEL